MSSLTIKHAQPRGVHVNGIRRPEHGWRSADVLACLALVVQ